ncbi:hypothetical protein FHR32_007246 [Streptosporangium album]|uniref:Uncharacterized protein n=1 Tax=Streptosporangium album TaxID=47479 RepID=A0A7W7S2U8_9ACTN|nr:hypothetical protein [Streptosporangium album]
MGMGPSPATDPNPATGTDMGTDMGTAMGTAMVSRSGAAGSGA